MYRFPEQAPPVPPPWRGTLLALGVFAALVAAVALGPLPALVRLDAVVSAAVRAVPSPSLDTLALGATLFGDFALTTPLMAVLVALLLARRERALALHAAWLFVLTKLAVSATKVALARARPLALYEGGDSYAFPSGHATSAAVLLGVVGALFLARREWPEAPWLDRAGRVDATDPADRAGHATRAERVGRASRTARIRRVGTVAAFALPALLVALSRVRLGAHWPSDVVGGLALATALVLPFAWHARRVLASAAARDTASGVGSTAISTSAATALPWLALAALVIGYCLYAPIAWRGESARYAGDAAALADGAAARSANRSPASPHR